jgi:hypothetical protein
MTRNTCKDCPLRGHCKLEEDNPNLCVNYDEDN